MVNPVRRPPLELRSLLVWREKALGIEEATLLHDFARDLRGDPRLTHWEEEFAGSIQLLLEKHQGKTVLSPKQLDMLRKLHEKTQTASPEGDETASLEDDEEEQGY